MRLLSRFCALALVVTTITFGQALSRTNAADAAGPAATQTTAYAMTFSTSNQSLWGSGGGIEAGFDKTISIVNESWNSSSSSSSIQSLYSQSFGGSASASSNGQIALGAHFRDFSGGQVSVNYPVEVDLTTPAARSFAAGQTVRISSSWHLRPGATITVAPIPGKVDLVATFKLYAGATGQVCIFTCANITFFPALNIDESNEPILTSDEVSGTIPSPISSYVSGHFNVPNVPLTMTVGPDGKTLTLNGSQQFASLTAHLEKWATYLLGLPPLAASASYSGASGGYSIFSSALDLAMQQAETITFTPAVDVSLALPTAVPYTVRDAGGNSLRSGNGSTISYEAGQTVDFTYPSTASSLTVTPTFSLANQFSHSATTTFTQDLTASALSLTLVIPSALIIPAVTLPGGCIYYWHSTASWDPSTWGDGYWECVSGTEWPPYTTPAVYSPQIDLGTIGPVWSKTIQSYTTTDTSLFDGDRPSWSLPFASNAGAAFDLLPDRAPVAALSGPSSVGEGVAAAFSSVGTSDPDGQALTYAWSFGDGTTDSAASPTHVYADDGSYPVTLTVTDPVGLTGTASTTITVTNQAPSLDLRPISSTSEGTAATIPPTRISDPGTRDTHTASVDWGDGTGTMPLAVTDSTSGPPGAVGGMTGVIAAASHIYGDNGTYAVTMCVADDDGASRCATSSVVVTNVAPTVTPAPDETIAEGQPTLALDVAAFRDPGGLDTHTATIDWGDGSALASGVVLETGGATVPSQGTVRASHVYADDGLYAVVVCVRDDDGARTCATRHITVQNVAPTVVAGPDQTVDEGTTVALAPALFNDKGTLDTHHATVNWGDGTATEAGVVNELPFGPPGLTAGADGTVADSHVYADDGSYTVAVAVTDDDGATATSLLHVTVSNVAPTVQAGTDRVVDEGATLALAAATFHDAGTRDTHTATIDWGDGSPPSAGAVTEAPFGPPGSTAGANGTIDGAHVYADSGSYTVKVCVTDDDGATGCGTFSVTVNNVAPVVNAGGDRTVNEGTSIGLAAATFHDQGTRDTHTATIDWGDGSPAASGLVTESPFGPPGSTAGANGAIGGAHVYADDGTYTVTVCVTDDDGGTGCATFRVTVNNVAPTVSAGSDRIVDEGTPIALSPATFHDQGTLDTHTATVDWGDGTAADVGVVGESPFGPPGAAGGANGTVLATHTYDDNGVFTAVVCVSDDDGARTCSSFRTTVNNVPPTAHIPAAAVSGYWGMPILLTADITDPSRADSAAGFANHWSWGDGTADFADHSVTPAQATHTWSDVGSYTVRFDATDKDGGTDARSRDSKTVTIDKRPTTISCAAAQATFGYTSALSASLVDRVNAANARLAGRPVTFTTGAYAWTATTDGTGLATSQTPTQPADGSLPPLLPGTHTITVSFAGDGNYLATTATCDYTIASSDGAVQGQTQQGPAGSLGQVHIRVTGADGTSAGEVFFKTGDPWILRSRAITGLGISPDRRSAWISGTAVDGRGFVVYAEDNGPAAPSIARLWIGGVLRNGDGVAGHGQVHIR